MRMIFGMLLDTKPKKNTVESPCKSEKTPQAMIVYRSPGFDSMRVKAFDDLLFGRAFIYLCKASTRMMQLANCPFDWPTKTVAISSQQHLRVPNTVNKTTLAGIVKQPVTKSEALNTNIRSFDIDLSCFVLYNAMHTA
eukprot:Seg1764.7 transcript_id=Seg1764.7/GoldUCD/mRNA.D3Y31 product="hypothetical protein" protein_id=Seg1764.7/GoldUCD/D3Y31